MTAVTRTARELPTEALKLHPAIQRFRHEERPQEREKRVRWLVEHWDPVRCDRLLVVQDEAGEFLVLRGGHRLEAARRLQIPSLPCEVVVGAKADDLPALVPIVLDMERRIRGWTILNEYLLSVQAELEPFASIERTLNRYGVRVAGHIEQGYICVDKLLRIYGLPRQTHPGEVLDQTIEIIQTAWPDEIHGRYALTVHALGVFIHHYRFEAGYDSRALRDKLSRRRPDALLYDARDRAQRTKVSAVACWCQDVRDVYNQRRERKLPEWGVKTSRGAESSPPAGSEGRRLRVVSVPELPLQT